MSKPSPFEMSTGRIWRPYTQEQTALPSTRLARAQGAYLFTKDGQEIFDGISSWWLITHGHCHPAIVEAVQRQAATLDQVTFANFSHDPADELAELLVGITPPELTRVFFSDNGSTAVEVALKMALQACAQSGKPQKTRFLAFASAYHGDTVGAMSVSGDNAYNRPYRQTLFDVVRAAHPTDSTKPIDEWIRDFQKRIEAEHDTLAAVILEPLLQGAGGMIVWPVEAVQRIAQLCRQYGVLLVFDEIMTGFGRTGRLFAMDRLGVTPDLLCLSKGLTGGTLPLAVTLASEAVYMAFLSEQKGRMLFHGHSFTGNPISCAAAVASLKLWRDEAIPGRLEDIARTQREELARFAHRFSISDPRVCGTVAAFELRHAEKDYLQVDFSAIARAALEKGLYIRPMGSTFYLMPPLCSTAQDLRQAWDTLAGVLV